MSAPDLPSPIAAEEIFRAAAALPAAERAAYLDKACDGKPELRARVGRMLEVQGIGALLQQPADETVPPEIAAELARLKPEEGGERIGNYKLLQQIGEGGFGIVWMAEQIEPVRRRVALKIIKLGMDTKEVIARFEQERQALAMMDHPNIAKVFDAGATPTGRPFFVMELVRGIPITDYCDQNNLPTAERLGLFIAVCHAVQHAHQKGVIHRDLKPSNILVTLHDGVPVPKVIDFGVAKATQSQRLTDLTLFTQFEQMIGTPLYMSPEQAELSSLDIDTRSDIYSLGVLLYELLAGRTPFDPEELMRKGYDEIRRAIREQEPQKPSTVLSTMAADARTTIAQHRQADGAKLVGLIRGDLDWIVMKALEKDRARRYETANGLAMDLQRHLANEPVLARPPTAGYRFRRLVRRNRIAFAAGLAVVAALSVGITVSTILFIREKDARVQANAVLERLRATAPTFHGQAKSLVESGDLEAALEKIGFAVELQPRDPAYRLFRAHTLQASQRLAEAAGEYRMVLELQPGESAARSNLALCEKLLTANGGSGPLRHELQMALVDALIAQGRHVEAGPLSAFLRRDQETAEPVILARLKEYVLQPGWHAENVSRLPNGTFRISFRSLKIGDLTRLRGLPVSFVSFWNSDVRDLSGLGELPLTHLEVYATKVTDLSPLRGLKLQYARFGYSEITDLRPLERMPLEELWIDQTGVLDLSPLRESPLRKLELGYTKIEDLRPLQGMALEELGIEHTEHIVNLEVLRGMPLRRLNLLKSAVTDLSPLQDCAGLEEIVLPENPADLSFLRSRTTLRRVGMGKIALMPALDFWRRYDGEKAGQPDVSDATLLAEGRFTEMEERLRRRIESGMPDPRIDWMRMVTVALASGDGERYRSACRDMLDHFKDTAVTGAAEATAKVCLLGADPGIADSQLTALLSVTRLPEGETSHFRPWTLLVRGLHEYRTGRWAEAIQPLSEVKGASPAEAAAAAVLAMARHQQKDPEATAQLDRARELINPRWPQAAADPVWWHDWLIAHLLLKEAERAILGTAGSEKVK